jgi:hypothetical protein
MNRSIFCFRAFVANIGCLLCATTSECAVFPGQAYAIIITAGFVATMLESTEFN